MLKHFLFLLLLVFGFQFNLLAQVPQVPSEMEFADIHLKINDAARKEIQTHVDALYRSDKYFKIKLERVDLYFPIIEKILAEEHVPDDFKYLVIQESALISDAVSSSNAVGFWQFKESSGEEVGLRIDGTIDERKNIVASTRGAARYLKRNNNFFDNWLYALQAYNMGAGGAQQVVNEKYFGKKRMEIDKHTHWYIIKFLAHKVAFENVTGKDLDRNLELVEFTAGANKNLKEIAEETQVEFPILEEYNKWLKRGRVPNDKTYSVLIPTTISNEDRVLALNDSPKLKPTSNGTAEGTNPTFNNRFSKGSDKYPIIEGNPPVSEKESALVTVNGKPGIIAGLNDNLLSLAQKGDISISRFLKYNDLESNDKALAGQVYYLKNKRGRAKEHYHVVLETENMWSISQKYGIKLKKLLHKNRMEKGDQPKPGRVLWMRFLRPSDEPIEYKEVEKAAHPFKEINVPQANEETNTNADGESAIPINKNSPTTANPPIKQTENQESLHKIEEEEYGDEEEDAEIEALNNPTAPSEPVSVSEEQTTTEQDTAEEEQVEKPSTFGNQEDIKFVEQEPSISENNKDTHIVKPGETLYGIAKQYQVKLGDLLYWNNLSLKDGIHPEQVLKIAPPPNETMQEKKPSIVEQDQFIIHEVAAGETMYKIARDNNVTIKDVMQWNNKEDFKVSVGEKLKIRKVE